MKLVQKDCQACGDGRAQMCSVHQSMGSVTVLFLLSEPSFHFMEAKKSGFLLSQIPLHRFPLCRVSGLKEIPVDTCWGFVGKILLSDNKKSSKKNSLWFVFQVQVHHTGSCCSYLVVLRHRPGKQVGSQLRALLKQHWDHPSLDLPCEKKKRIPSCLSHFFRWVYCK